MYSFQIKYFGFLRLSSSKGVPQDKISQRPFIICFLSLSSSKGISQDKISQRPFHNNSD